MFENLARHDTIIVTGPQRAGTRITAKAIAHDTGHIYIDERDYTIERIPTKPVKKVIQGPRLAFKCHLFGPDVLVVFCIRKVGDILRSQKRINWGCNGNELKKYRDLRQHFDKSLRNSCEVKYQVWESFQRPNMENYHEAHYEELHKHPLFVPKKQREGFKFDQTK